MLTRAAMLRAACVQGNKIGRGILLSIIMERFNLIWKTHMYVYVINIKGSTAATEMLKR